MSDGKPVNFISSVTEAIGCLLYESIPDNEGRKVFYAPDELLPMAGRGTPEEYLAKVRARLAALGPDATEGLRKLETELACWKDAFDRPALSGNRESVQAFVRSLDQLLQEIRRRLG